MRKFSAHLQKIQHTIYRVPELGLLLPAIYDKIWLRQQASIVIKTAVSE